MEKVVGCPDETCVFFVPGITEAAAEYCYPAECGCPLGCIKTQDADEDYD